ncbi:MAG TPA: GWxTD domain-containing protein, partial [Bryobacteraceae bacterium]|nr:GWxTD domain-containing protein [Bryobacteraceae bacterium]
GDRLGVTGAVSLLESSIATVPVVIGFVSPVILTPVGMLAGMPASQIECILLHELAHIRRADYLANLLQTAAEALLFYHPAVWWMSRVIRVEREKCCDDVVVSADGDAHDYATALSALAGNRLTAVALPANGGDLMNRIRRLLYPETASSSLPMPLIAAGLVALVTTLAATAWQTAPPALRIAAPPAPIQKLEAPKPATRQIAQAQTLRPPVLPPAAPPAVPELETPWKKWLNEDVVYIITAAERDAFRRLQTDDEREKFVEQFWLRRDPTPDTPLNEYQQEHYRRIAYANNHFVERAGLPGWKTDRGRIYITFGPPDELEGHGPAFEIWHYRFIQGIGNDISIEFVDSDGNGQYHMTMDPNEADSIRVQKNPQDTRLRKFE